MTTIKIKNGEQFSKTDFENLEDLLDWAIEHYQENQSLSPEVIKKAAKAKREIESANSTFRPAE
jgi:hypothetical protein